MVVALVSLTAGAQVYVGGGVGLWRNRDANTTNFALVPEVGYKLSDRWSIGTTLGYEHAYTKGEKVNGVVVSPYARYNAVSLGRVTFFVDGGFGFSTFKVKGADSSSNGWQVGVSPGLSVALTDRLNFISHVGFLGWRDSDDGASSFGGDGFGFSLSGNDLTFGINYNF